MSYVNFLILLYKALYIRNIRIIELKRIKLKTGDIIEAAVIASIWLVILCVPIFVSINRHAELFWPPVLSFWRRIYPYVFLTLLNHFILIPYLLYKSRLRYLLVLASTLIIFLFILQFIRRNHLESHASRFEETSELAISNRTHSSYKAPFEPGLPPIRSGSNHEMEPFQQSLSPQVMVLILALLVLGFDTGLRSLFRWSVLEKEKIAMERENAKSELAFLRNQVSPHFLMNTLNNIHSLIDVDREEAKKALIKLSNLMRQMLYDNKLDMIPLSKEVEFLDNYVGLMKMRLSEKVEINKEIGQVSQFAKIPPMLFTTIIENAFKYGISNKDYSFIHIALSANEHQLNFEVKNRIAYSQSEHIHNNTSENGLESTRKRLNLFYKDRYALHVNTENNIFTVQLNLPI